MQGFFIKFFSAYLCALSPIIFELSPIIDDESLIMFDEESDIGADIIELLSEAVLSVVVEVSLPFPHAVNTAAKTMIDKNFFIVLVLFAFF